MMNETRNFPPRFLFLARLGVFCLFCALLIFTGCKAQTGTVMKKGDKGLSGSHKAGQEIFKPLVEEAVGRLLARETQRSVGYNGQYGYGAPGMPTGPKRICFVEVENRTAEELGDNLEMLYEMIDTAIGRGDQYITISRRYVQAAIRQERFRMDDLFVPANQRKLLRILEQQNQPFEYLLFAKIVSGTTVDNKNYQRDYNLSLELININTGDGLKESHDLSKAYNVTLGAKIRNR